MMVILVVNGINVDMNWAFVVRIYELSSVPVCVCVRARVCVCVRSSY